MGLAESIVDQVQVEVEGGVERETGKFLYREEADRG